MACNDKVKDDLAELISLYSIINEKSKDINNNNMSKTDYKKSEIDRLTKSFSFRWNHLSIDKQKELVDCLLEKGLLPGMVKDAIDIFEGAVISLV